MIKKSFLVVGLFLTPVLALAAMMPGVTGEVHTNVQVTTSASTTAAAIACVGVAVATREAAIDTAVATHGQALQAAYSTRATELAGAYSNTTTTTLRAGVKVAWADFTKSAKSAAETWRTSRNAAWTAFRAAVKVCKAPSTVTDSANSSAEVSGQ